MAVLFLSPHSLLSPLTAKSTPCWAARFLAKGLAKILPAGMPPAAGVGVAGGGVGMEGGGGGGGDV